MKELTPVCILGHSALANSALAELINFMLEAGCVIVSTGQTVDDAIAITRHPPETEPKVVIVVGDLEMSRDPESKIPPLELESGDEKTLKDLFAQLLQHHRKVIAASPFAHVNERLKDRIGVTASIQSHVNQFENPTAWAKAVADACNRKAA